MIEVIAEIANSHQGKISIAKKIINNFKNSGSSSIKFQIYFADEFMSKNHSRFKHFKKQGFSHNQLKDLFNYSRKLGYNKIYADVLGFKAFEIARSLKVDGYKIHSTDLMNLDLLKKVSKEKKKVFLSVGGAKHPEIYKAVKIFNLQKIKPVLMHGYQSYPTKVEDTNLKYIAELKRLYKDSCYYGFQDHISGSSKYNLYICLASIGFGINYIEKHITLNRKGRGIDYYSSLEPKNFKNFCEIIRKAEKAMYQNSFLPEDKYRKTTKKFWIVKKSLKRGKILKRSNLEFKRIDNIHKEPLFLKEILNKKIVKSISKSEVVTNSHFKKKIVATVVARLNSKRLPKKALIKVGNFRLLEILFIRLKTAKFLDELVFCTTKKKDDDKLSNLAKQYGIKCFRGEDKNVLGRIVKASKKYNADIVIRITGDDIFIDIDYLKKAIEYHLINNLDYTDHKLLPSGTETEVFNFKILELINDYAEDNSLTEYLTYYIDNNRKYFRTGSAQINKNHISSLKFTIDTKKDIAKLKPFLISLNTKKKIENFKLADLLKYFNKKNFKNYDDIKKIKINTNLKHEICQKLN